MAVNRIIDTFRSSIDRHWTRVATGGARIDINDEGLHIGFVSAEPDRYTDAQIDDYTMLSKKSYLWRPPLRMTVRAKYSLPSVASGGSHYLKGTAGFGFWNKPFTMQGNWFSLPRAIWFFYSAPPSNMALSTQAPACGWKAQIVNTTWLRVLIYVLPTSLVALYGRLFPQVQVSGVPLERMTGAQDALIEHDMTQWHDYTLEWRRDTVRFFVDEDEIAHVGQRVKGPLGFVLWLDNEYAVATPRGELSFGKTSAGEQWLTVECVAVEPL